MTVLGLGRHDWGDIHNIAGVAFTAIVGLHLVLPWRRLMCLPKLLAAGRDPARPASCPESVAATDGPNSA